MIAGITKATLGSIWILTIAQFAYSMTNSNSGYRDISTSSYINIDTLYIMSYAGQAMNFLPGQGIIYRRLYRITKKNITVTTDKEGSLSSSNKNWTDIPRQDLCKKLLRVVPIELVKKKFPKDGIGGYNIGCPDCRDQGGIYLEFVYKKKRYKFNIDPSKYPRYLKKLVKHFKEF